MLKMSKASRHTTAPQRQNTPTPAGKSKLILFRFVLVLTPVFFFLLLELLLRLFHYGSDADLFQPWEWKGKRYMRINAGVADRYFARKGFSPYVSRDAFLVEKPAHTVRIFCLGESTTAGYPYFFNGSFSSLLRDRLADLLPDENVEVVNVGITAVNSYAVADLAREIMPCAPDLIIAYVGHNEFYGAMGVASTEFGSASRLAVRAFLALRPLRTVQLMRSLVTTIGSWMGGEERFQMGKTLMEQVVGDKYIQYRSPEYELARKEFQRNLTDMVETAQRNQVPIMLCTLASNLRDQYPFVSMFADDTSPEVQEQWNQIFHRGAECQDSGEVSTALQMYSRALQLDSNRADLHFRIARGLEFQGRMRESLHEYTKAKDLDGLRFRASEDFNKVIRHVGVERHVPVVEMGEVFAKASPDGIPGASLFWEHVHPQFAGYNLMAKELCSSIAEGGILGPTTEWQWNRRRTDSAYADLAPNTPFDAEVARLSIELLKSHWPFRDPPLHVEYHPKNLLQETAWDRVQSKIGWAAAHSRLGDAYAQNREWHAAQQEYFAIAKAFPYDPQFFDKAGELLVVQRKFGEAAEVFRRSLRIHDSQFTRARLAEILLQMKDPDAAATNLETALQLDVASTEKFPSKQRVRAITLLANAYLMLNRLGDAERKLQDLLAIAPNAPETKALQVVMVKRRGRKL